MTYISSSSQVYLEMAQTVPRSTAGAVKQFASIPGPASLPLVGTSLMYKLGARDKTQYHLALMDMFRQHGPLVRENIGGKTVVHVFDPEDIKNVYNVEGKRPIVPPLQVKNFIETERLDVHPLMTGDHGHVQGAEGDEPGTG